MNRKLAEQSVYDDDVRQPLKNRPKIHVHFNAVSKTDNEYLNTLFQVHHQFHSTNVENVNKLDCHKSADFELRNKLKNGVNE